MKKLFAVLLCLAFATFLSMNVVGCGDKKDEKKTTTTTPAKT